MRILRTLGGMAINLERRVTQLEARTASTDQRVDEIDGSLLDAHGRIGELYVEHDVRENADREAGR